MEEVSLVLIARHWLLSQAAVAGNEERDSMGGFQCVLSICLGLPLRMCCSVKPRLANRYSIDRKRHAHYSSDAKKG